MTDYAVPGTPTTTLPPGIEDWEAGIEYAIVPWSCPVCDQVIADTLVKPPHDRLHIRTYMRWYSPVRKPDGDLDGLPFWSPTIRGVRDRKGERRKVIRLGNEAASRSRRRGEHRLIEGAPPVQMDHSPIEDREFDGYCDNCSQRVRFLIATGIASGL